MSDILEKLDKNNVAVETLAVPNEALELTLNARDAADGYLDKIHETLCSGRSADKPLYCGNLPALDTAYLLFGSKKADLYHFLTLADMSINSSYMTKKQLEEAYEAKELQLKKLVESKA